MSKFVKEDTIKIRQSLKMHIVLELFSSDTIFDVETATGRRGKAGNDLRKSSRGRIDSARRSGKFNITHGWR